MQSHCVKVTFANGDHLQTEINGTRAEVRRYYAIGRQFNLGSGPGDNLQPVSAIEFTDPIYRVVRMYAGERHTDIIATDLTREEAVEHCRNKETSSRTCTSQEGIARTELYGHWFDGFEVMPGHEEEADEEDQ